MNNFKNELEYNKDKIKRNEFFNVIRQIYDECKLSNNELSNYIIDMYGIDVFSNEGFITHNFTIINEQKYLLFRIKYGI